MFPAKCCPGRRNSYCLPHHPVPIQSKVFVIPERLCFLERVCSADLCAEDLGDGCLVLGPREKMRDVGLKREGAGWEWALAVLWELWS